MTDCGDCPGLLLPRAKMVTGVTQSMGTEPDAIHLGTCIKLAHEHGNCPMDLETIKAKLEAKLQKPVLIGTHPYV